MSSQLEPPANDPTLAWAAILAPLMAMGREIESRSEVKQLSKINKVAYYNVIDVLQTLSMSVQALVKKVGIKDPDYAIHDLVDFMYNDTSDKQRERHRKEFWDRMLAYNVSDKVQLSKLVASLKALTKALKSFVVEETPKVFAKVDAIIEKAYAEDSKKVSTHAAAVEKLKSRMPEVDAKFEKAKERALIAFETYKTTVDHVYKNMFGGDGNDDFDDGNTIADNVKGLANVITIIQQAANGERPDLDDLSTAMTDMYETRKKNALLASKKKHSSYDDDDDPGVFFFNFAEVTVVKIPKILAATQRYIDKQKQRLEDEAEAPPKALMGRIAFPSHRSGVPLEPDTQREQELYHALVAHFDDNEHLDASEANTIRVLLSRGWYADVFKEPTVSTVYRGMSVPKKWLQKAIKKSEIPSKGKFETSFTYTPRHGLGSSSWSTAKNVATTFHGDGSYDIIMYARTENNSGHFVTGPGGLYNVRGFEHNSSEKEVVGLGRVKVFKVEWRSNSQWDDTY